MLTATPMKRTLLCGLAIATASAVFQYVPVVHAQRAGSARASRARVQSRVRLIRDGHRAAERAFEAEPNGVLLQTDLDQAQSSVRERQYGLGATGFSSAAAEYRRRGNVVGAVEMGRHSARLIRQLARQREAHARSRVVGGRQRVSEGRSAAQSYVRAADMMLETANEASGIQGEVGRTYAFRGIRSAARSLQRAAELYRDFGGAEMTGLSAEIFERAAQTYGAVAERAPTSSRRANLAQVAVLNAATMYRQAAAAWERAGNQERAAQASRAADSL